MKQGNCETCGHWDSGLEEGQCASCLKKYGTSDLGPSKHCRVCDNVHSTKKSYVCPHCNPQPLTGDEAIEMFRGST